ncbi:glycoside hydrolase family protein [Hymenobacter latericus]|uniref:hypothetical protein n=1 Tax=Hymenobacter sp. YIM 151858-1 TaxID=2987688 RepID=UPI0022262D22|nr:hypothetical protein [Hymenobacter sp. YIM 151858-1]UYZ61181.1 hypothetical protein OIS50_19620 [Hymenobacter sp. YIM 151858-1]
MRATEISAAPLGELAVYGYCVDKSLNRPADPALTQRLYRRLPEQLDELLPSLLAWQLDTLCAAAWLQAAWSAEGVALPGAAAQLAQLDEQVQQRAVQLSQTASRENRRAYFRSLRYLNLRRPMSEPLLWRLLEGGLPPLVFCPGQAVPLGLNGGLAGELLLLLHLHRDGVAVPGLDQHLRVSLQLLFSARQSVDFQAGHYSVFPYELRGSAGEPAFSAELSWQRGDLGLALLFYEAAALFDDQELFKTAELVGLNALLRTSTAETLVTTAGWQRGAAGLATLYAKLHQLSGQPAYRAGYDHWLGQTQRWLPQALQAEQQVTTAAVSDTIRVGLVLLSALKGKVLLWESALLY